MTFDRRDFLKACGSACAATLAPRYAFASSTTTADTLIVVFLRGGMDGLNVIAPVGDPDYLRLRPTVHVAAPGSGAGAGIALDSYFAMHASMAPLDPLYRAGRVAFVHAAGFAQASRSHFECQDRMERASLDLASVADGWLGRHLAVATTAATFEGVGVGVAVPAALRGPVPAVGLASIGEFTLRTTSPRKAEIEGLFDLMYDEPSLLGATARQAIAAVEALAAANPAALPAENGAQYPATPFGAELMEIAQLVKADLGLRAACVDLGGWDHHEGEAGEIAPLLDELARAVLAFDTDLGAARRGRVTLVTVTEFGRRAKENASAGTDHGSAYAMLVYGGGLAAGKVHADWPTLADAKLRDGDLDITIDYRTVLAELLERRGGGTDVGAVFPGYSPRPPIGIFRAV